MYTGALDIVSTVSHLYSVLLPGCAPTHQHQLWQCSTNPTHQPKQAPPPPINSPPISSHTPSLPLVHTHAEPFSPHWSTLTGPHSCCLTPRTHLDHLLLACLLLLRTVVDRPCYGTTATAATTAVTAAWQWLQDQSLLPPLTLGIIG